MNCFEPMKSVGLLAYIYAIDTTCSIEYPTSLTREG